MTERTEKREEFVPTFRKFTFIALPGTLVAIALLVYGTLQYRNPASQVDTGFPPISVVYYTSWIVGAAILVVTWMVGNAHYGRKIVLTPKYFEIHRGQKVLRASWGSLSYTAPHPQKRRFRSAIVSDGQFYERIEEFFYDNFNDIILVIEQCKQRSRDVFSME